MSEMRQQRTLASLREADLRAQSSPSERHSWAGMPTARQALARPKSQTPNGGENLGIGSAGDAVEEGLAN